MKCTVYECDGCGDRFGVKNDVAEYTVKRAAKNEFLPPETIVVHFCVEKCAQGMPLGRYINWVGVDRDWEVVKIVPDDPLATPDNSPIPDMAGTLADRVEEALP